MMTTETISDVGGREAEKPPSRSLPRRDVAISGGGYA